MRKRLLIGLRGLSRVTLQPSAGAQGELAGILMVRAALAKSGNPRKTVLILLDSRLSTARSAACDILRSTHMNELRRKCPLCGGELIRSRSATFHFWRRPWPRKLFDWGNERVFPWACMGCGVILLYLERLPVLTEEAESTRVRAVAPKAQPAHLKS